eukprot:6207118-Pleurochrysis_carterae.AAC.2
MVWEARHEVHIHATDVKACVYLTDTGRQQAITSLCPLPHALTRIGKAGKLGRRVCVHVPSSERRHICARVVCARLRAWASVFNPMCVGSLSPCSRCWSAISVALAKWARTIMWV